MLEALRLSDLLKPLMATLNGVDTHFDSVSIDARTVERGGLFVALGFVLTAATIKLGQLIHQCCEKGEAQSIAANGEPPHPMQVSTNPEQAAKNYDHAQTKPGQAWVTARALTAACMATPTPGRNGMLHGLAG